MLSLCMIVKNEEQGLAQCLDSARALVDEVIVVDTGSNDKTKEIAFKYTNKVYDFTWENDFSKARNFSISKANNDWILVLDADEIVTSFNIDTILKFIKSNDKIVGRIKRINVFEDSTGEKRYIERINRLFNKNYYNYLGTIHEQVTSLDDKNYETTPTDITVDHIGYTKEILNKTNKISRNISMLKQAIDDNSNDPYLNYQLGKSYYMGKEYALACQSFEEALKYDINFNYEYAEDLVETYGYSLINTNRFIDAIEIEKFHMYYKEYPDFNFLMGLIYMNNGRFNDAVSSFHRCIGNTEGKIEGVNSYLAYYNIGVIFECLGYTEEAFKNYNMCGNYKPALSRLSK